MATGKTKRKPAKRPNWQDVFYVRSFEFARSGLTNTEIARSLGVPPKVYAAWVKTRPALHAALTDARSSAPAANGLAAKNAGETFLEYVYNSLPSDLQELWDEIEAIDEDADKPVREPGTSLYGVRPRVGRADRVERLFTQTGIKRARQRLWIHALVASNFNANEACRKVNITKQAVEHWRRTEPDFDALFKQTEGMIKDFGEACLFRGMAAGEGSLIVFFNATKNADRGYVKPARNVNVNQRLEETKTRVDVAAILDKLPIEQRKAMLDAIENSSRPAPLTVAALTG